VEEWVEWECNTVPQPEHSINTLNKIRTLGMKVSRVFL